MKIPPHSRNSCIAWGERTGLALQCSQPSCTGVDKAATLGLEFFQILVQTVKTGNSCGVRPCLFALPLRLEKGLLQASFGRFPQSIAHSFALEIRHGRTASNF